MPAPNYRRRLLLLILIASALRLLLAGMLELGNDEVYYWTYAQRMQWNYFDHPPLVAIWIRLFTGNLELQYSEVFVRLGSVVSCAVASSILFHTVRRLHSERAAWITAVLYHCSIYAGIIAGLFILPDSPQMLFWCAALYFAVRIHESPRGWKPWIGFGLMAGLSILGKVHGVFLWFGMGLFILARQRAWLARPQLYVAAVLTALVASPILIWNLQNDFITYRFHSERVTVQQWAINWSGFARELGGQVLYNNPVNVLLVVAALAGLRGRSSATNSSPDDPSADAFPTKPGMAARSVFVWIGLPMIIVLLLLSLLRDTLPHWSGPGHVTLLPVAAIYLAEGSLRRSRLFLSLSRGFVLLLCALALALTYHWPGTMGSKDRTDFGFGDFTLDLHGWSETAPEFAALYQAEKDSGNMPYGAPLIAYKWFPAAHEDYYWCAPNDIPVIGLGDLHDLHHYAWLNRWRLHQVNLTQAWCVVPSNEYFDARTQFNRWYQRADSVTTITQLRGGQPARYFTVWKLSGWKTDAVIPVQGRAAH
ncbi:MAG: glycosyltransferase family 39 protein [Chitinophagaceae bacterium]|nr:MAG: glycosyltransferase family 39 protein [Chitinophagaceae bacterium]